MGRLVSTVAGVLASVIQGLAVGPASYIVTCRKQQIFKFARAHVLWRLNTCKLGQQITN